MGPHDSGPGSSRVPTRFAGHPRLSRLSWILLVSALAWWFAFDRVWPRIGPRLFARVELVLLVGACGIAVLAWRRERTALARARLGLSLAGLGLYAAVALLGLRFVP